MASKKVEIRAANRQDLEEIGCKTFGKSMRALSLLIDGELMAIAGVLHTQQLQAFTNQKPEASDYPVALIKFFKRAAKLMELYEAPIYAKASDQYLTSDNLCRHFNFVPYEDNEYGRIYICQWPRQ